MLVHCSLKLCSEIKLYCIVHFWNNFEYCFTTLFLILSLLKHPFYIFKVISIIIYVFCIEKKVYRQFNFHNSQWISVHWVHWREPSISKKVYTPSTEVLTFTIVLWFIENENKVNEGLDKFHSSRKYHSSSHKFSTSYTETIIFVLLDVLF